MENSSAKFYTLERTGNSRSRSSVFEDPAWWFEEHHPLIERISQIAAKHKRLTADETEEFTSQVCLQLVENDFSVLQSMQHEAAIVSYLTTVITRKLLDFLREKRGRWRPSAQARQLGETAVKLEELLCVKKHSQEDAYQILTTNFGYPLTRAAFREMAECLNRQPRPVVELHQNMDAFSHEATPESEAESARMGEIRGKWLRLLESEKPRMTQQDALMLRLKFRDERTVTQIARVLGLTRRQAGYRLNRVLRKLRRKILDSGISPEDIQSLLRE